MFSIYPLSEQSVTLEFGQQISGHIADAIYRFDLLLKENPFRGFITTVTGYTTLTVFYSAVVVNESDLPGVNVFSKIRTHLESLKSLPGITDLREQKIIKIPVLYGGCYGPDLEEVANHAGMPVDQVINIHSSAIYKIFMIGFVPGFPYLGGMDERISAPRKSSPRAKIPAGSVGIAGSQTGIYSLETPGGWQIIGRTPLTLFDHQRVQPSLLQAGESVKFVPITAKEFNDFH
ncbi:5-oxoprolinase subunit PxpB [Pedobacter sp. MC2016-14]|uniref:5-oxoprolinase subunit PxpB n=1 Tax=Pedobacter sp. MC2016-14 TaxID=2897327 RepID=UPI001E5717FF|nr:5-oxoprolinase subunit PxpB [Pedobacter sp. MC2016-14]MCD0490094.1 5-oxoprolinase subunit PxpB [Pedobacter sp. MC2016-14]